MELNSETKEKIKRFLDNQCVDVNEANEIAEFLAEHPEILDSLLDIEEYVGKESHLYTDKLSRNIRGKIRSVVERRTPTTIISIAIAAAASVILFFGVSVWLTPSAPKTDPNNLVGKLTIANNSGVDSSFLLPDGSRVVLSGSSKMVIGQDFKHDRYIVLTGNAVFKVAKDPVHPFIVESGAIKTKAVGTEFKVSMQNADQTIRVTLLEGKVVVFHPRSAQQSETYLKAGEELIYGIEGRTTKVNALQNKEVSLSVAEKDDNKFSGSALNEQKTKAINDWTNESYTTSKASLIDVFNKISKRYKVVIVIDTASIRDVRFTGEIMYSDRLDVIIPTLCNLANLDYTQKGDSIFVKPK